MSFCGYLKADTQTVVTIGPFVDVTNGYEPETGIALNAADEAELLKHGSTAVVNISSNTWSAVSNCDGYYSLTLTAGNLDTEGQLTVIVQDDSVCLPVRCTFQVVNDNSYEAFFENASEILTVNVTQLDGSDPTDEIRDAIVDDSTLIDASLLNTHSAITAASITDDWETQSQADPTGFHVNVKEVNGTAQAANDNSTDINAILADTGSDGVALSSTAITAIWAKAMSDLATDAPAVDASVLTAINYLYEAWRNRTTTTAGELKIFKDDASTGLVKSTISDLAGTFTKGKFGSGA